MVKMVEPKTNHEKDLPLEATVGRDRIASQSYKPITSNGAAQEGETHNKYGMTGSLEGRLEADGGTEKETRQSSNNGDGEAMQEDTFASIRPGLEGRRRKSAYSGKSGHSASLRRSRSYGDGHGFIVYRHDDDDDDDEEADQRKHNEERGGDEGEKEFQVRWDGEADPMNPRNLGTGRKWIIVLVLSAGSTCVTCTSSMYTSTYEQITVEFGVSRVVATLGLSLFVMGLGLGPMLLGQLCRGVIIRDY